MGEDMSVNGDRVKRYSPIRHFLHTVVPGDGRADLGVVENLDSLAAD